MPSRLSKSSLKKYATMQKGQTSRKFCKVQKQMVQRQLIEASLLVEILNVTVIANVALTSASPPDNDIEPKPLNEESQVEASQVAATQAQQPSPTTPPASETYCFYHKMKSHAMNDCEQFQRLS